MAANGKVEHEVRDGVAWVTLSRPEKRNALTRSMWAAIPNALAELAARPDVVAVALRGASGIFGAGADLADVLAATAGRAPAEDYCSLVVRALLAVARCPLPTLALVSGLATGGAAELALAADARIADPTAIFSFPFARLGVVPDRFTLARLVALVGPSAARRLVFTGDAVLAAEACAIGLVDEVVPIGSLAARVEPWRESIARGSCRAIAAMKGALLEAELPPQRDGSEMAYLIGPMIESFVCGDVRRAASGFLDNEDDSPS